jgi:hypothetical protein
MKNRTVARALALAAVLAATGAMAQTGRPAEAPAPRAGVIDTRQDDAGAYAHYLMLNGVTRDEAIRAAQGIDHPAPRHFAWHQDKQPATRAK